MVCGPASRPCPASSLRTRTIRSAVPPLTADGDDSGRRDRGSNAASPFPRYRAASVYTHDRATP